MNTRLAWRLLLVPVRPARWRSSLRSTEHRPVRHQPPALLQRVTTPVGLLGGVADDVGKGCLDKPAELGVLALHIGSKRGYLFL